MKIEFTKENIKQITKQIEEWLSIWIDNMLDQDWVYDAIDTAFRKHVMITISEKTALAINDMIEIKLKDKVFMRKFVEQRLNKLISKDIN